MCTRLNFEGQTWEKRTYKKEFKMKGHSYRKKSLNLSFVKTDSVRALITACTFAIATSVKNNFTNKK